MSRGFLGIVSAELSFPGSTSLKDKRVHMRAMRDRLTRRHGATFSEVGLQERWRRAHIVCAIAGSEARGTELAIDRAVQYLGSQEWELVRAERELVEIDV
jgi:uncharacterized protein YlxP (DUF503 family)